MYNLYDSVNESITIAKLLDKNMQDQKKILSQDLTPESQKRLEALRKSHEELTSYLCR